jgi:4-hydroxy-3-methylbut-2-enyl diphosphate reductase
LKINLSKYAGFCPGVRKADETVRAILDKQPHGARVYTLGQLIHNRIYNEGLAALGAPSISFEDVEKCYFEDPKSPMTLVIRTHGITKEQFNFLSEFEKIHRNFTLVDATCPFVKRIHRIVQKESREGKHIVIVGNPGHPEVEGIMGWCEGSLTVLETEEEAQIFNDNRDMEICIVSQTTFNYNKFQHIVAIFQKKGYNDIVVNTICNATEERQTEAREIASKADIMIVIGGKHSSNTRKLYEICSSECANTYFIQTLDDLHLELPKSVGLVGITAGASTPNKLIEEVQNYVRINF